MAADVGAVELLRQQLFEAGRQRRLQRQQLVGQHAFGFLQRVPPLPERVADAPGAGQQIVDPVPDVVATDRLRCEFRQLAVARQRNMCSG